MEQRDKWVRSYNSTENYESSIFRTTYRVGGPSEYATLMVLRIDLCRRRRPWVLSWPPEIEKAEWEGGMLSW